MTLWLFLILLAGEPQELPRLSAFLQRHPALRVQFTEILRRPTGVDTVSGWLWIQKPDRIRVETPEMVLVQRGSEGVIQDRTTGRVSRYQRLVPSPLSLWIADSLESLALPIATDTALLLVPRARPQDTLWVVLIPSTGAPRRLGYRSPDQQRVFHFHRWTDEPLPDSLFQIQ